MLAVLRGMMLMWLQCVLRAVKRVLRDAIKLTLATSCDAVPVDHRSTKRCSANLVNTNANVCVLARTDQIVVMQSS
jgi:hypothetical protein